MTQKKPDKLSFVVYNSFFEAAENLNGDDFKKCFLNLRDYALFGIDEDTDNWAINIILSMAKPLVASARKRYENCVENGNKGRDYGKNGGRPKKTLEEKPQEKPLSQPLNDNAYVNNNVYTKANADSNAESTNHFHNTLNYPSSSFIDSLQLDNDALPQQQSNNKPTYYTPASTKTTSLHDECLRFLFKKAPNEMNEVEYYELWLSQAIYKLVRMDDGALTKDDKLFFEAVKYYMLVYKVNDKNQAIKDINQLKRIAKPKIDAYLKDYKGNGGSK